MGYKEDYLMEKCYECLKQVPIDRAFRDCVLCNDTNSSCEDCSISSNDLITFEGVVYHICFSCIERYRNIGVGEIGETYLENIGINNDNLTSIIVIFNSEYDRILKKYKKKI